MGLDMYLYRVTRLTPEEKEEVDKMSAQELYDSDFNWYVISGEDEDDEDAKEERQLKQYILPYVYITKKTEDYWDVKKLKEHFGVPEDAQLDRACPEHYWGYSDPDSGKPYAVDLDKIREEGKAEEFIKHIEVTIAVFKAEKIAYWRKHYTLQDALYEAFELEHGVEPMNCQYVPLNEGMRKALLGDKTDGVDMEVTEEMLETTPDSEVFYYEWY